MLHQLTSAVRESIIPCLTPAACSANHIRSTGTLSPKLFTVVVIGSLEITVTGKGSIVKSCSE